MLTLFGQISKYSNEFLSVGIGARALSMANSTVASVNDNTAGYWNPSGLTNLEHNLNLGIMHSEYFAGVAKFDYGSVGIKNNDTSAFGLTLIRFGVDDIPNTLDLKDEQGNIHYDRISSFSIADYAFIFSYARKAKIIGLKYGANAKIIRRIAGKFGSAWGFGFDASAQYYKGKWQFGAIARDVTSTFNAWKYNTSTFEDVFNKTGNEIPKNGLEITMPKLIIGVAYKQHIYKKIDCLAEINADFTFDKKRNVIIKSDFTSIDPHLGLEFSYNDLIFVRTGIGNIQKIPDINNVNKTVMQPNIGIGIRYKRFGLDYALTNIGNQNFYSNIFSLLYCIYKK